MTEDSLHPGSSCLDTSARRSSLNLLLALALVIVCGVVFAGPSGVVIVDAQMTSPPSEEKQPPKPRSSAGNPVSGNPEAIEAGRKLYSMWCVQCHGHHADGVSRFGKYAADPRAFWRGYSEFDSIVKNGRTERQMPPWKEVLDDAKIAQVGAFLEGAGDRRRELEIA